MCPNISRRIAAATFTMCILAPTVKAVNGRPDNTCTGTGVPKQYDLGLHVAAIFVVLVSSALGITLPIFTKGHKGRVWTEAFFIAKYLGTGVIIATAFVHLLFESFLQLNSKCIKLAYAPASQAIAMGAMFIVFFIDLYVSRILYRRSKAFRAAEAIYEAERNKSKTMDQTDSEKTGVDDAIFGDIEADSERADKETRLRRMQHKQKLFDVAIIEGGIVFHSVMVGLGLGVAGGKGFIPYFVAIAFHQMFDGFAIGTRLAQLNFETNKNLRLTLLCLPYMFVTPFGIALGVICRTFFNAEASSTILAIGVLDSISAGVLLYGALIDLLAKEFFFGDMMEASDGRNLLAIVSMLIGAGIMSLMGKWA